MKDPVSEPAKVSKTKGITFNNFDLIVKTFNTAVSIRNSKGIQYLLFPVENGPGKIREFPNLVLLDQLQPLRKFYFSFIRTAGFHKIHELFLEDIGESNILMG